MTALGIGVGFLVGFALFWIAAEAVAAWFEQRRAERRAAARYVDDRLEGRRP